MIKLNKRYRLKIVQAYAPTSSYDDQAVDRFYGDVESAMNKGTAQFTIAMGDFNAKAGAKQMGERSIGNSGIGSRNRPGDTLVGFAERNNLRFMNTFFCKRRNRKWTWKSPYGKTKNEIDFILSDNPGIVQDLEVLGKIRNSDHRMVRCKMLTGLMLTRCITVHGVLYRYLIICATAFLLRYHFPYITPRKKSFQQCISDNSEADYKGAWCIALYRDTWGLATRR